MYVTFVAGNAGGYSWWLGLRDKQPILEITKASIRILDRFTLAHYIIQLRPYVFGLIHTILGTALKRLH